MIVEFPVQLITTLRCGLMWWVVAVVSLVVMAATYLTWTAGRIDRLQGRVAAAFSALDAHLVRRAAAAVELAEQADQPVLATAAREALSAHPDDREAVENDLTRALRTVVGGLPEGAEPVLTPLGTVLEASRRVALARQVHNDLVRDALVLRHRWLVRLLRIGGHHPRPYFFDIDDPVLTSSR